MTYSRNKQQPDRRPGASWQNLRSLPLMMSEVIAIDDNLSLIKRVESGLRELQRAEAIAKYHYRKTPQRSAAILAFKMLLTRRSATIGDLFASIDTCLGECVNREEVIKGAIRDLRHIINARSHVDANRAQRLAIAAAQHNQRRRRVATI